MHRIFVHGITVTVIVGWILGKTTLQFDNNSKCNLTKEYFIAVSLLFTLSRLFQYAEPSEKAYHIKPTVMLGVKTWLEITRAV